MYNNVQNKYLYFISFSLSFLFLNFISQTCFIKYKTILTLKDRYFLGNVCSLSSMKTQTNQCTCSFTFVVTC